MRTIYMENSIMTTGSNRSIFNPGCCEYEQYRTPDTCYLISIGNTEQQPDNRKVHC